MLYFRIIGVHCKRRVRAQQYLNKVFQVSHVTAQVQNKGGTLDFLCHIVLQQRGRKHEAYIYMRRNQFRFVSFRRLRTVVLNSKGRCQNRRPNTLGCQTVCSIVVRKSGGLVCCLSARYACMITAPSLFACSTVLFARFG